MPVQLLAGPIVDKAVYPDSAIEIVSLQPLYLNQLQFVPRTKRLRVQSQVLQ